MITFKSSNINKPVNEAINLDPVPQTAFNGSTQEAVACH